MKVRRPVILVIVGLIAIALSYVPFARTERRVALVPGLARATFAGGCFWCMEPPFERLPGVLSVTSGYTGGDVRNPSYSAVSAGGTGHLEAVEVIYDPRLISYETLLGVFWRNIDPENGDGQFCDFGEQYRSAVFVHDATQKSSAEASLDRVMKSRKWVRFSTFILPAKPFHFAEAYHQDYHRKNPVRYWFYRRGCGRDERLDVLWGAGSLDSGR